MTAREPARRRPCRTAAYAVALLAALAGTAAVAQAAPEAPPPAAEAPAKAKAPGGAPARACTAAKRRAENETAALAAATASLERERRARETCSTKSMCARYDEAIKNLDQRRLRHETRLARFRDDAARACAAPQAAGPPGEGVSGAAPR